MRGLFGLVGLVVVLAIVGIVAKKQLSATRAPAAVLEQQQAPGLGTGASAPAANPGGNVRMQSQQVQQQVQQQLDDIMKQRSQDLLPESDK
ncbi:hypothetical protein [Acidovorax sp. sic0104]|uniref:hypothetical protein n=1 Tax=Acidovorax sp. sic0104 TaxID=2854784 RepID=UPI001C43E1F9|nr:hypothetical protein [Acidovorax sp. sic0104]MBV7540943.1 hypothetical protein [Acidovorax sp. sic0104]